MCYMSHVTYVISHKYKIANNFTKYTMCYMFLESYCKIKFNGHAKMPHMLHVTNIKLHIMLPKSISVIYFWNNYAKSRSMVMLQMSHVTRVTCHKYNNANNFNKYPCGIYFWNAYAKSSPMVMLKTSRHKKSKLTQKQS